MLLKLKRTQRTKIGQLKSGVAYSFDMKDKDQSEVAKSLLESKMAEKTTIAQIEAEAEQVAERQRAELADASDTSAKRSAISEKIEADQAAAEAAAAQKTAEEAAAKKAGDGK